MIFYLIHAAQLNVMVINALAKNVHAAPTVFCPLLMDFVNNDQGKLLTLLVLNKALALNKKESEKSKTLIRETLFKILQDRCSLSDLLSGNGITAQEASKFNQDLSHTLESVPLPHPSLHIFYFIFVVKLLSFEY